MNAPWYIVVGVLAVISIFASCCLLLIMSFLNFLRGDKNPGWKDTLFFIGAWSSICLVLGIGIIFMSPKVLLVPVAFLIFGGIWLIYDGIKTSIRKRRREREWEAYQRSRWCPDHD